MEQSEIGPITSGRDLLAHLNLTEEEAADWLGRSSRRFHVGDVVQLRLLAHAKELAVENESGIVEYVRSQYGDKLAERVQTAFEQMSAPPQFEAFQEIWVLIPDVESLKESGSAEFLRSLLPLPGTIEFLTGGPFEQRRLREFLGEEAVASRTPPLIFRSSSTVSSQATMLLGDPSGEDGKAYYLVEKGYLRVPLMDGKWVAGYAAALRGRVWIDH